MTNCKNCGHEIEHWKRHGAWNHITQTTLSIDCRFMLKANKKIRQQKRDTEPIKYLMCGCTNPEPTT
ncbi:hypothetical protein LCGC14_2003430 [marine sediment metagenome]|uniref:Uncharacterized protein n=1 Tax=marine sediment metagenome TaxID=412755 RepID=A0A0F9F2I7_9ZZZZ